MSNVVVQKIADAGYQRTPVFEELNRLREKVQERAFKLFEERGATPGRALDDWIAAEQETLGPTSAQVLDNGTGFEIQVSMPGCEASDIEITVTPKEILVFAADARPDHWDSELIPTHACTNIYRDIELPESVDLDHVAAELDDGLLRITAPKASA